MKKFTRILSMFLAGVILATLSVGCSNNETNSTTAVQNRDNGNPEYEDFGEKTFTIWQSTFQSDYKSSSSYIKGPESMDANSDMVEISVFQRNSWLEDTLNCSMDFIDLDFNYATAASEIRNRFLAETGETCDLVIHKLFPMANLSLEGFFTNISNNSDIDYWSSYWYGDFMNELSLDNGNTAYLLAGDFFIDVMQSANILVYNVDLMDTVYSDKGGNAAFRSMVLDKEWTLEKMIEVVKNAYLDNDGVAGSTPGDTLGFAVSQYWAPTIPLIVASDLKYTSEKNGTLVIDMNNDRSIKAFELLKELLDCDGTTQLTRETGYRYLIPDPEPQTAFATKKALILGQQRFGNLRSLTDLEFNWSVLPYPKLDDQQKDYITPTHDTTEIGAIPRSCADKSAVLRFLEIASQQTHQTVMQDYYEKMLKSRYSQTAEVAQIVELIHDHLSGSFALAYSDYCKDAFIRKPFYEAYVDGLNFTSAYKGMDTVANNYIKQMVKAWDETLEE